ncbi:Transglutaminase-like superfamily protein [Luteibacter sp. UNCMF331Sha3.1]|uniref:transglutaminase-like domain-containing protein n=1 Tax=Luteibacter sp. UNCMF331Sha3.1 TaxID=1502760 RepID=UPI0008BA2F13|nr:transglutaminase-like domain-containing protein [Luteibacter sp. UNCMF331Sha3.1]SEM91447.1 Transglutaminase-like superfamily protein [Luteibacter sp. UNCMF331Sha3.1]
MGRWTAAALLFAVLGAAHATPTTRTWMSVTLDGRKVGSMRVERGVADGNVVTTQAIDLRIMRGKSPLAIGSTMTATETIDGDAVAFASRNGSSTQDTEIDGSRRDDGQFQVTTRIGEQTSVGLLAWPDNARMSEGQRLLIVREGFAPGHRYRTRNFDATKQQVATLDVEVVGDEIVELPDGDETLHHLRQSLADSPDGQRMDLWVDDAGTMRKGSSPAMGRRMEMLACSEACAMAPGQDVDVLRTAMILAPRTMTPALRSFAVRYTMTVTGGVANPFATTDEQQVKQVRDGVYDVTIGAASEHAGEGGPTKEDLRSNPWVQSDAPDIVALATKAVGNADTDMRRMVRLRSFVTGYIEPTVLDVGYGSALETLRTRQGDCTEHAVLLAALGRSLGIPTRIVTGLVYTDRFANASRVYVPHTWVQSWVEGRWVSFDSANRRFDTTHIALGVGNGDPWRFFSAMASLGRIRIDRVVALQAGMNMPPPPIQRVPPPEPFRMPPPPPPSGGKH